jgi:CheY-like chemotaxis protein
MPEKMRRVLLAEDDRFLHKAASIALRRKGYEVLSALDGQEALRLAREEAPDVILLDLIMPKIQGFEVLRSLKADPITSRIPVIILTNLSQDTDRSSALTGGAREYLVKANLSLDALAAAVDRVFVETL